MENDEKKQPKVLSLELLRELELQRDLESVESETYSALEAETELDFNEVYTQPEYEPDFWEQTEEDEVDDSTGGD